MATVTDPIILDSTGQAIKNSIDLLTANINRTASNIPYDNNLTIKGKIDAIDLTNGGTIDGSLIANGNITSNLPNGTTSTLGESVLIAGNAVAEGSDGNSRGRLRLYSNTENRLDIMPPNNLNANRQLWFPIPSNNSQTLALRSDLGVCDELLAQTNIPAGTPTSYNCDWSSYYFLSIEAIQYGNVVAQILVPTSYFNTTNSGNRPVITNPLNNMAHSVYKNGNSAVYITASSAVSAMGIRIYGIMKK